MHTVKLNNGELMPVLGFGTWQTPDGEVAEHSVYTALKAGYRHIDTAAVYGNEGSVGDGIIRSGVAREEIFLTTKLWNDNHSYEGAKRRLMSLSKSYKLIMLIYILFTGLIH